MLVVRRPDVLWRVTADRVLLRRVGPADASVACDLFGAAALVWVAADRPSTVADLAVVTALDEDTVRAATDDLLAAGWVVTG